MAPRTMSAVDAAALLHPTDSIGLGLGPANPPAFLDGLGTRDDWEALTIGGAHLLSLPQVLLHPNVEYRCGFFGPAERLLRSQGARIELVPGGFRQFTPILRRLAPRVMAVQATPPGPDGTVNLSLHLGATYGELLAAGRDPERLLVVEINPDLPRTASYGPEYTNTIPLELIDVLVPSEGPPFTLTPAAPDEMDRAIAGHALEFIPEGATLQIGIGAVPDAVAEILATGPGEGYGVHSEMFGDGLMALQRSGKVTNANKGQFAGRSVTTFALGSGELNAWLDGNEEVAFLPVDVVNDPDIIGGNHAFVSINGAISVDLYGQVVADSIEGRQISGVGGHEDFVAGAELSLDDCSLICLRSTALVGEEARSRIVGVLPAGSVVSTPRHHTAVVVTEYGAADLRGATVTERARRLAAIAHPDARAELEELAERLGRL